MWSETAGVRLQVTTRNSTWAPEVQGGDQNSRHETLPKKLGGILTLS